MASKQMKDVDCVEHIRIVVSLRESEPSESVALDASDLAAKDATQNEGDPAVVNNSVDATDSIVATNPVLATDPVAAAATEPVAASEPARNVDKKAPQTASPASADTSAYGSSAEIPVSFSRKRNYAFARLSSVADKKQLFNSVYFTLAAVVFCSLAQTLNTMALYGGGILFSLFAIAASAKVRHSDRPGKTEVRISRSTRRMIRAMALLIPIPIFLVAGDRFASDWLIDRSDAQYEKSQYTESIKTLDTAAMIDPFRQEMIFARKAGSYWANRDTNLAIDWSKKALALDPNDGYAWSTKAAAMVSNLRIDQNDNHQLAALKSTADQDYIDAGYAVNEAIRLYPDNGENYRVAAILNANENLFQDAVSSALRHKEIHNDESVGRDLLAEIYYKFGDYPNALKYADETLTAAKAEGNDYGWALYLRAQMLDALGRTNEAAADRATADTLGK